ncbi:MAG: cadmium-translocating P-type ATPase [Chlamydiales bacterium]|nr:cadmium-translocating P-type ATPase [Chlamydiales bacterium]
MAQRILSMSYSFDDYFAQGSSEAISPFLTARGKLWAKNLHLRASILSALLLALSFGLSFYSFAASRLALIFVYFIAGTPALLNTIEDLKGFEINIDVLMTLAAFLSVLIGAELEGALLLVLFAISGAMEEVVMRKTQSAINSLRHISPTRVTQIASDGSLFERSIREIGRGEKILVRAGELIPLDGVIKSGASFVNLVHLTGESVPLSKGPGDEVPAGARNIDGQLTVEVLRVSSESTLTRIIKLIEEASSSKPRLQRTLDRFGKPYAMTIIGLATLFALALPLFGIPYSGIEGSIYRALAFLIAASPCALIIATPTAYLSALSACAKQGILLKGGVILDSLASCHTIAFDKTGTLTTGELECIGVSPANDQAIAIAAGLERGSKHPIAHAILAYAQSKNLPPAEIENFKSIPGSGLEGRLKDGTYVAIGNLPFISAKTPVPEIQRLAGELISLLLIGTELTVLKFSDHVRPGMLELISALNLEVVMLTGDHHENALSIAKSLNIQSVHADLKPEDKLRLVSELSQEKGLAMVGDGINDAPALARATVGIAMGKVGSMAAIDASDIIFLHDDLEQLPWLIKKAHHTLRIVKQNLGLALAVIFLVTTPALLGYIPLWLAVVLHEGGTVIVGLNGLRLSKTSVELDH